MARPPMTQRRRAVEPLGWTRPRGYSNGVLAEGRFLFVAGQIGWDARTQPPTWSQGFAAQFDQALKNVADVVREAGGEPKDLVRMTLYVTDKAQYVAALRDVGASWRRHIGRAYPAMTLVQVSGLLEDRALLELEATALL